MKKTLHHLIVLSCQRASLLIEKEQYKPLSFIAKAQLNLHLKICSKCLIYQKQSILINSVLTLKHQPIINQYVLSDEAKDRLLRNLNDKLKEK